MVNELVDDNAVAAPWNDDWRQELHSFLSWLNCVDPLDSVSHSTVVLCI